MSSAAVADSLSSNDRETNNMVGGDSTAASQELSDKDAESTQSHPLEYRWVLHFNAPSEARHGDWNVAVKKVMTISTVEEFWSLLNNIKNPAQLQVGSNYHFFKEKINPEWEDDANKLGGKWAFAIKKGNDGRSTEQTDKVWLHTLLMLIGDQFTDSHDITGFVVSPRGKENRLAIWTRNADAKDVNIRVGQEWKKIITEFVPEARQLGYTVHADAMASSKSYKNEARYQL